MGNSYFILIGNSIHNTVVGDVYSGITTEKRLTEVKVQTCQQHAVKVSKTNV